MAQPAGAGKGDGKMLPLMLDGAEHRLDHIAIISA
jgi:hypothetical protein